MKIEIALEGIEFYAYHGYYEEERKTGNKFIVDVRTEIEGSDEKDMDELSNTINYEEIYSIVKENMSVSSKLLEHVAKNISDQIINKWREVQMVSVRLAKINPPIGGMCHKAVVTITQSR